MRAASDVLGPRTGSGTPSLVRLRATLALRPHRARVDHAMGRAGELVELVRLLEHAIVRTDRAGARQSIGAVPGDEQDRQVVPLLAQPAGQLRSVDTGHHD